MRLTRPVGLANFRLSVQNNLTWLARDDNVGLARLRIGRERGPRHVSMTLMKE